MLDPELRRRLEELNRGPLRVAAPRTARPPGEPETSAPLNELVPGRVVDSADGPFYLVERRLAELYGEAEALAERFVEAVELAAAGAVVVRPDDVDVVGLGAPEEVAFLDIETAGLCGAPLFLAGVLGVEDGRFVMRQFLARDYAEERRVIGALSERLERCPAVVTFNGKSFDVPFVLDRAAANRVAFRGPRYHLDVLHCSRRRWGDRLPNCQLQTLEYYLAGRRRAGDIPGALIPEAYHEFVRTGDARRMKTIVHHNALDLVTMVELVVRVLTNDLGEPA